MNIFKTGLLNYRGIQYKLSFADRVPIFVKCWYVY